MLFFGKNYGYKILRTLAITRKKIEEKTGEIGLTVYEPRNLVQQIIYIKIDESVLTSDVSSQAYKAGWFTSANINGTFVHEFGHLIDFFQSSYYPLHERIDNTSGLDNDVSKMAIVHNEYKIEYCQKLGNSKDCPYQVHPDYKHINPPHFPKTFSNSIENHNVTTINYAFDQNEYLKNFIFKKVKNLDSLNPKSNQSNEFVKNMILKMFINSIHGRTLDIEVPSEGFTYWLLTPENERDKAWEIWNEFYLEYLPAIRKKIPHFNDYKNMAI